MATECKELSMLVQFAGDVWLSTSYCSCAAWRFFALNLLNVVLAHAFCHGQFACSVTCAGWETQGDTYVSSPIRYVSTRDTCSHHNRLGGYMEATRSSTRDMDRCVRPSFRAITYWTDLMKVCMAPTPEPLLYLQRWAASDNEAPARGNSVHAWWRLRVVVSTDTKCCQVCQLPASREHMLPHTCWQDVTVEA
jgi:hypothetical protein